MDEQPKKRGRPRNPANYYVDNDELYTQIKLSKRQGFATEKLGRMLLLMHDHILKHSNFRHYSKELKEDMKSFSLLKILKTFSPRKPQRCHFDMKKKEKCFGYYSHAIFNNYLIVIGKHYKYLNGWKGLYEQTLRRLIDLGIMKHRPTNCRGRIVYDENRRCDAD